MLLLLLLMLLLATAVAVAFTFDDALIEQHIAAMRLMKPLFVDIMLHATPFNRG